MVELGLDVFKALPNPNRIVILAKLPERPRRVTGLSRELGLTPPHVATSVLGYEIAARFKDTYEEPEETWAVKLAA